ncbi:formate dehydrogenase accessory sulfurtransferase FdhD [Microbacterium candidum]|uniref:Sulfur carrier protein FdhD n=1 Tax=Microbacterium candidum TaxID=3041922 RepID=A0ABT7N3T9_9MICO|nr:formate dehydrogenase accessory sulfurtransferase FdhD [Microbacterium sp. ASV49]MDL9981369.1 formate dehydrogenase accessory sulfurtransferase FdhD [Microbacterium sp. ASV49]
MGRLTMRRPVRRIRLDAGETRRIDTLAVEEPLEIRVGGQPLAVTMRTPGHDVELAAGFLVSEGVISSTDQFRSAIHCGGPGTSGGGENTYNVLDVALASHVHVPVAELARSMYTTSSCGICGKASIDAVRTVSAFDVAEDATVVDAALLATFPDALRAEQAVFEKTGGLHAAALFDAHTGKLLVLREDVGRHNAVDKVVGWALLEGRLPLRGRVLMVSGRAGFELAQKAVMAGAPILAAVSAPSSLAVEMAADAGLTVVGFLRGPSMNVYAGFERVQVDAAAPVVTA